jgi:hypothetical protein
MSRDVSMESVTMATPKRPAGGEEHLYRLLIALSTDIYAKERRSGESFVRL